MPEGIKVAEDFRSESMRSLEDQPVATARWDQLTYMADMLLEMKKLAENEGCSTLAGLLSLAHSEALLKASRR